MKENENENMPAIPPIFSQDADIVENLRAGSNLLERKFGSGGDLAIRILRQAAKEIEHLREEVKRRGG